VFRASDTYVRVFVPQHITPCGNPHRVSTTYSISTRTCTVQVSLSTVLYLYVNMFYVFSQMFCPLLSANVSISVPNYSQVVEQSTFARIAYFDKVSNLNSY